MLVNTERMKVKCINVFRGNGRSYLVGNTR